MKQGQVQAQCPTCGSVVAPASALVCGISDADQAALCELSCPRCGRTLLRQLAPLEIPTLLLLGARRAASSLPFELLEVHSGPAVSWDEVLDLHLELELHPSPQEELARGQAA